MLAASAGLILLGCSGSSGDGLGEAAEAFCVKLYEECGWVEGGTVDECVAAARLRSRAEAPARVVGTRDLREQQSPPVRCPTRGHRSVALDPRREVSSELAASVSGSTAVT